MEIETAFLNALQAAGLDYTGPILADGQLHRIKVNGDRKPDAWYVLHADDPAAGIFGHWKTGLSETWKADSPERTDAERAEQARKIEAARMVRQAAEARRNDAAASQAQALLDAAQDARNDHPYLIKKGVKAHPGVKISAWRKGPRNIENCLLIPLRFPDGRLATVQAIFPHIIPALGRNKDFLSGGKKTGASFLIGDLHASPVILIAEGYATAATLYEATGYATVMAIDAGNLKPVVSALQSLYPGKRLVVCADNDRATAGNPGLTKATAVAKAAGAGLAVPNFHQDEAGSDFNDLAALHGLDSVRRMIDASLQKPVRRDEPIKPDGFTPIYEQLNGQTLWNKPTKDGFTDVVLCNFVARIVTETTLDDGLECKRRLEIEGSIAGQQATGITVPVAQFAAMGWALEHWGSQAVITAGMGIKDHLRCAIQTLSDNVTRKTIYQHSGWRQLNGSGWQYLFNGGAIGRNGLSDRYAVELPGALVDYQLEAGTVAAVHTAMKVLELAETAISAPLFAAPFAAILGEALPVDFSLFLAGTTGTRKTEAAAILQAFFGRSWRGKHLPAAWSSTGNSLERTAFLTKDAILTVDDFCPHGTTADIARYHKEADRILRAQGNRAGRMRMAPDGTLKPAYFPRGLIVATGEDIPRGQSLRGRMLVLEFAPSTIDLGVLSALQEAAATGELAVAAGCFAQWLAARLDALKLSLPVRRVELRTELADIDGHSRHPDTLATLLCALEVFASFADDIAIRLPNNWLASMQTALLQAGRGQAEHQASEEPAGRFVTLIHAALSAGLCHVKRRDGREPYPSEQELGLLGWQLRTSGSGEFSRPYWEPQGVAVGWFDIDGLYLEPDVSYRTAKLFAESQGQGLPLSKNALQKALDEKGLLITKEKGRTTIKVSMGKAGTKRVIHIGMLSTESGESGESGEKCT